MLPRNQRMELLSKAYVRAVVAFAGGICVEPIPDFGIDLTIHHVASETGQYTDEGALINLQLRSTTEATYDNDEDAYHYELDVKTYNHLRKTAVRIPRLLILFVMPKEETIWVTQEREGMTIRNCAYYLSLKGHPTTTNEQSITVAIPCKQIFSMNFLQRQFQKGR
jgi:Domain of unknown function (DUF4365)